VVAGGKRKKGVNRDTTVHTGLTPEDLRWRRHIQTCVKRIVSGGGEKGGGRLRAKEVKKITSPNVRKWG